MIELILEALDVPRRGWPGRRRYIAGQLWRMAVEGVVFILFAAAILAALVTLAAATNTLPVQP